MELTKDFWNRYVQGERVVEDLSISCPLCYLVLLYLYFRRKTVKQKKAQIDRGKGTELSNCRKLLEFYWNTPIVIFVTHVVSS